MGKVNKREKKIKPLMFKKYFWGKGPSNLKMKAKKTEREIKKMSEKRKNKNFKFFLFKSLLIIFCKIFRWSLLRILFAIFSVQDKLAKKLFLWQIFQSLAEKIFLNPNLSVNDLELDL